MKFNNLLEKQRKKKWFCVRIWKRLQRNDALLLGPERLTYLPKQETSKTLEKEGNL